MLFLYVLFCLAISIVHASSRYTECPPTSTTCEYWLVVQEYLTMVELQDKVLVYPMKGRLYRYNDMQGNQSNPVSLENIITVDGKYRMVVTVNKTIPGPPLVVYENQELVVHVHNLLPSSSVTIHWHGLHQVGTPFMDGIGYITQCPIGSGQKFTYRFKASPKGTFWYHSHVGAKRSDGIYGALIIKERPVPNMKYPNDVIMTVGDWHHVSADQILMESIYGNFKDGKKRKTTRTLDGSHFSNVPWVSGLIDGRGRYTDPKTGIQNEAPLTWYNVTQGETYRFRAIQVGAMYPLKISVDDHAMKIIATDGSDVEPMIVDSFIIFPGERYDFLLEANQPIKNYWIRAVSIEVGFANHSVEAILHYDGAGTEEEPTTNGTNCNTREPCLTLNCPFSFDPNPTQQCVSISDLKSSPKTPPPPVYTEDSVEHFLNFAFPDDNLIPGTVNGRKFLFPGVNSLTEDNMIGEYECEKKDCGKDKICSCHYQLDVPFNETIQMVWLNMGRGAAWGHPIHMHGHSFHVLKVRYANQDPETGRLLPLTKRNHPDVDCDDDSNMCNEVKWKNQLWKNGNIPGMNLKNPPMKDTLLIPPGGYAVLRIKSDNPGKWFIHCHIDVHMIGGMAMVLSEAQQMAPEPPDYFPVCNNFYDVDIELSSNDTKQNVIGRDGNRTGSYMIPMIVMGSLILLLLITLISLIVMRSRYSVYRLI